MSGCFTYRSFTFSFPATEAPSWASQVERWYQLDAFAFGLPQAAVFWKLDERLRQLPAKDSARVPQLLILASPEGSNRTDSDFAHAFLKTGIGSPSKFVHTLPNSRSAALLQVLGWSGQLFCFQNDPSTMVTALKQAMRIAQKPHMRFDSIVVNQVASRHETWIFGITRESPGQFCVHLFQVSPAEFETADSASGERVLMWRQLSAQNALDLELTENDANLAHAKSQVIDAVELTDQRLLDWLHVPESCSVDASGAEQTLRIDRQFEIASSFKRIFN